MSGMMRSNLPRALGIVLLTALLNAGCRPEEPTELRRAARAVASLTAPRNLSRSAFAAAYPAGEPSEFVSYMFSPMGKSEWPPSEDGADPREAEAARSINMPLLPAGVAIVPFRRRPDGGAQLVVRADDAAGLVVLEGYGRQDSEPVLRREIRLVHVEPDPMARRIFESNADMGIGYGTVDRDR